MHPDTADAVAVGKRFAEETKRHEMWALHDSGLYRHLRFKRPDTISYYFDLITWPSYLTIAGDMGVYTFRREQDMFGFFRTSTPADHQFRINPGYWGEKVRFGTDGGNDSVVQYSQERLVAHLRVVATAYAEDWPKKIRQRMLEAFEQELVLGMEDIEATDLDLAYKWYWDHSAIRPDEASFRFNFHWDDVYDAPRHAYSVHFLWCLHAIVWGIDQYDSTKKG